MFNKERFNESLVTNWLGSSLLYFESLDSTNSYAKNLARDNSLHGTVILADEQSDGRGQYNRDWIASPGRNLTFSIIFEPASKTALTTLSLACALAVADVSTYLTKKICRLKWPNDVLSDQRKIAGVLTETVFSGSELTKMVVGLGINVNQKDFSSLNKEATSLYAMSGIKYEREKVLHLILGKIEYYYRLWETKDIRLLQMINKALIGYGEWVKLSEYGNMLDNKYKFLGINEAGYLVVLNKELELDTFAYEQIRIHPT